MYTNDRAYQKKAIRIALLQHDWTIRSLAAYVGVSKTYLHQTLTYCRPMPVELRRRILEAGMPADLIPAPKEIAA
jgi:hypothetical protein